MDISSDDEYGISFDVDLEQIDSFEQQINAGLHLPPRSKVSAPTLQQRDLFGNLVTTVTPQRPRPTQSQKEPAVKTRLVKRWDRALFAKHGWSKKAAVAIKAKGKKRKKVGGSDEENWDDEEEVLEDDEGDEDVLLDTSYDASAPVLPIKWEADVEARTTWEYPVQDDKPLRKYQYDIVHRALFDNTLVSLPTGLGKTFIAACIMLNFYRWWPKSKIIFMAPTRPLVTQQIKACHYICGIPQSDSVELTGMTAPALRALAWQTRRVIYCTPQTVENDLRKGRLDPRDVSLIVVDEAHRASGDYAYCGVVRYMMSRNPHFRVLALTATPGAKGEAVQDVIDNLHIGRIEVRTDESMDIVQYIHRKSYDLLTIPLGDTLSSIRDRWGYLMTTYLKPLVAAKLVYEADPAYLSPYVCQMAFNKINTLPGGRQGNGKFFPMIKTLGAMARAMEYLIIQSVTSFATSVKDLQAGAPKTLVSNPQFRQILDEVGRLQSSPGYVGHPKMHQLRDMCIKHFNDHEHAVDQYGEPVDTRVMVFCNFRAVVEELVDCLNQQRPLIKATPFVGQSTAKGTRGMSQKEQLETIAKFKKGTYNVLVASSIGEEGLDIGEIDLIVCYEANKSPIRMLQRVGRTGRARDGRIIVLMTEGREEKNWSKAQDAYNDVQNALVSNKVFELYADGDRMMPPDIKPVCHKLAKVSERLNPDLITMNGYERLSRRNTAEERKAAAKKEKKVFKAPPADAFTGFRTAGALASAMKEEKAHQKSPAQVMRERKKAALLTVEQEQELADKWQHPGGVAIVPDVFDHAKLPFDRARSGSAHKIADHSDRRKQLVTTLKATAAVDERLGDDNFDAWHAAMSESFNPRLVNIWDAGQREGRAKVAHVRMGKPKPEPPLSSMTLDSSASVEYPLPTYLPPKSRLMVRLPSSPPPALPSTPPVASSSSPPPRVPVPDPVSKATAKIIANTQAKPAPRVNQFARAQPTQSVPSSLAPTPQSPIQPRSQTIYHTEPTESQRAPDPFGMLSSDDEMHERATFKPDQPPPLPKPSTDFDLDDDLDLCLSDRELLAGAVVKGVGSASCSPVQAGPKAAGRVIGALTLETDTDEELERDVAFATKKPVNSALARFAYVPPPDDPPTAPIPDSDPASQHILQLPPSSIEAPIDGEANGDLDDDYSFFDMPDDAIDAAFDVPVEAIRGNKAGGGGVEAEVLELVDSSQPVADSVLMPPPAMSRGKAASWKSQVSQQPQQQQQYKPRPQRHVIPDSSSSSVRPSQPGGSFPLQSPLAAIGTGGAGGRGKMYAPFKQPLFKPVSSSPPVAVGRAGRKAAPVVLPTDTPEASAPVVLNRLRRGRHVVEVDDEIEDDEEAGEVVEVRPAKKSRKGAKKAKLTAKSAHKTRLFDVEAVNSDVDGSEASSEDYASEDSDDRRFVAGSQETTYDDSPAQAAFYRESLLSQAPPQFMRSAQKAGAYRMRYGVGRAGRPPDTPGASGGGEREDWSYDSFCVDDDAPIEYEASSEI